jgi:small-conductance mechanosensitive channel
MSFREKISWLSLGAILISFGPYFGSLIFAGGPPWTLGASATRFFIGAVTIQVVLMAVGIAGIILSNLKEAPQPSDERDKMLSRRASAIAYAILVPALFCTLAIPFFGMSNAVFINAILAAIVVAETVRYSTEIIGYRRGG